MMSALSLIMHQINKDRKPENGSEKRGIRLALQHCLQQKSWTLCNESTHLKLDSVLSADLNRTLCFVSLVLQQIHWLPPWHLPALLLRKIWEAPGRMRRVPRPSQAHLDSSVVVSMRTSYPSTAPPWQPYSSACSHTSSSRGEGGPRNRNRNTEGERGRSVDQKYTYRHFYGFIFTDSWMGYHYPQQKQQR